MSNTKAVHLKSYIKYILEHYGQDDLKRIFEQMDPQERIIMNRPVLTNGWLDYNLWWRLLTIADQLLGKGDFQLVRAIGAFDARDSLNGIYRTLISMVKPAFLIARSASIWRRYYDTGVLQAVRVESCRGELWLTDYPGLPLHHEWELIGWMEEAMKIAGARDFKLTHTTCLAAGDTHCTFRGEWQ
jgi:hypothetical protein